ncbi:uncharacterized protein LOC127164347 isoform X1 [Labeo rohita]|nr:uncharacterized protein LOC127164347 isoform X1 [Labeo rohita]
MKTVVFLCFWLLYVRYALCKSPSSSSKMKSPMNVYEFLWDNNTDIANETIHVDFLIQMQSGSLQAERYVNFTIQDIHYVLNVTDMLSNMSAKVNQPSDLKIFFKGIHSSYTFFADLMLQQYCFKGAPPIQQTPAMRKYLSFYRNLMDSEEPIYFAVGLLPCYRLWVWLADHLNTPPTNAYYTWKVENMGEHPEKYFRALLNKYLDTPEKVAKANGIFRAQMQNEHDFFLSS